MIAVIVAVLVGLVVLALALGRTSSKADQCGHDPDCGDIR